MVTTFGGSFHIQACLGLHVSLGLKHCGWQDSECTWDSMECNSKVDSLPMAIVASNLAARWCSTECHGARERVVHPEIVARYGILFSFIQAHKMEQFRVRANRPRDLENMWLKGCNETTGRCTRRVWVEVEVYCHGEVRRLPVGLLAFQEKSTRIGQLRSRREANWSPEYRRYFRRHKF